MGVTIVTGAGSGIGRATAERLVAHGGSVVAVDLDADALAWVGDQAPIARLVGDVTDAETSNQAVAVALERFGRLDGAVFNAGIAAPGTIIDVAVERFDEVMAVNVRAVVLGLKATIEHLPRGGSIVVTASISGLAADPGMWAYNASKAAVINLVRSAAVDLGPQGLRVNAVCPGPTDTPLTAGLTAHPRLGEQLARRSPQQRWTGPDEVAAAIEFLLSADASAINGVALPVDGGLTANNLQFDPPRATSP
ncbi:MAG: SDR family oxidoreductase [Acidimicrobiia bacterium]|nr:SDR family oxidoreductase [Acidimicrobiia bacterium]